MNDISFNKIINLELSVLVEEDFKKSIEYFFEVNDDDIKKTFLANFKDAVKYYYDNNLKHKVSCYPISRSNNKEIYKIDRLVFYIHSLYTDDDLKMFSYNKGSNKFYHSSFKAGLNRYYSIVRNHLFDEINIYDKLYNYRRENDIKKKFIEFDKNILEEVYFTFFNIDNKEELIEYNRRVAEVKWKYHLDNKALYLYIKAYGIIYLNLSIDVLEEKITSIVGLNKNNGKVNNINLIKIIEELITTDDSLKKEEIIVSNNLSNNILLYLYNNKYIDECIYEKAVDIINKTVNKLNKEYKYLHFSKTLSMIEKTEDTQLIEKIASKNKEHLIAPYIKRFVYTYRNNLTKEEQRVLLDNITRKVNKAKKSIKDKADAKSKEIKALTIQREMEDIDFSLLLDDSIRTIKEFCDLVNISDSSYYKYLKTLFYTDYKLYWDIYKKVHLPKNKRYDKNTINLIALEIKNGIEDDDGKIREFEALDYFLKTNLSYSDFIETYMDSDTCDADVLKTIREFYTKNQFTKHYIQMINIEQEINGTTIFMIDNEPYEVSKKEKNDVISFLNDKGIPLYNKVYKQALKRHIKGELIKEEVNVRKKLNY